MKQRLIDANALLRNKVSNAYISRFEIETAPTVDLLKHGKWLLERDLMETYIVFIVLSVMTIFIILE